MGANDLPLRSELTRAFTRLWGTRGGFSPTIGREIIPVAIMDTESWPSGRRFAFVEQPAGGVGFNAIAICENTDPLDSGSLVVIDWIRITTTPAADIIIGLAASTAIAYGTGPFGSVDVAPAPGGTNVTVANVAHGSNSGVAFTPFGYRFSGVTVYETPAHWPRFTIPPQTKLVLSNFTLNQAMQVTIGGRYYSAL